MELHEFVFTAKGNKRETFYIVGLGDLHYGTESFDEKKLKEIVKWIKDRPTTYAVGLGDYCELITFRDLRRFDPTNIDKRFRISDLQGTLTEQVDRLSDLLFPIRDRFIGLCDGNHEYDALKNYDYEATARLAQNLGTKHMGWTCLTRLVFRRGVNNPTKAHSRVLTMLTEHSSLAGRKKGGKVNRLDDRVGDWFDVDIILWGHSHDKVAMTKEQLYLPKKGRLRLEKRKIVAGIVPSFYKSYQVGTTSYSERRGYAPTSTVILLIEISPWVSVGTNEAKIELHISQ